jgi:hypothetical protein
MGDTVNIKSKLSDQADALAGFSTVFTNEKAGMQHVDKEKVKRIVYDMSKDSAHHENEQRKQVLCLAPCISHSSVVSNPYSDQARCCAGESS